MLIAHTQKCIVLPLRADGDQVNIEVDVLSKYVEASVGPRLQALEAKVFGAAAETPAAAAAWTPPATEPAPAAAKGSDGEMRSINAQVVVTSQNVHGAGLQVPMPSRELASTMKIGIIRTCWHSEYIDLMEAKCIEALLDGGIKKENVLRSRVSGSFELPYTAQRMIRQFNVDAVVTIGILLKGGTIRLLSASWLLARPPDFELPRRQDRSDGWGVTTSSNGQHHLKRRLGPRGDKKS